MGIAAVLLAAAVAGADPGEPVRVGVLAPEGSEVALRDWASLEAHLAKAVPERSFRLTFLDIPGLRRAAAAGELEFAVTNAGLYVELEAAHGASRIATIDNPQVPSPARAVASAVVVRATRTDLRDLSDLRGKSVAAVEPGAFGGWQLAWRELLRAGVDPERHLASLHFEGFPMQRIVAAVREGRVDAGVVRSCLVESLVAKGEVAAGELRVLGAASPDGFRCARSTPLYPDWPFAVLKNTPRDLARRVATALLTMPPDAGGVAWTVPADYQPVRDLFRELRVGPYANLREPSFSAIIERYWGWALVVLAALLAVVAPVVRVDALVLRRTRELRAALDERDRARRASEAQREKMDHLARLSILGEMASMLAHEINQPLSTIGNFAEGIGRRLDAGRLEPEPIRRAASSISAQAARAGSIMDRIRAFARKRESRRERVDLAEALDASVALLVASGVPVHPVLHRGPGPAWVEADRLQIEQVILNLLKNAHDALDSVALPRLDVTLARSAAGWTLAVRDNGVGLPPESLARLFEPFFTTKPEGLGLGLAICHSIVEAHGGSLTARANAPDPGLTVAFELPAPADE